MNASRTEQLTTFKVGSELFGIEVMRTQEVTGKQAIMPVPLAPAFVKGLINLRGQIATALGLHELFASGTAPSGEPVSVVCKIDGNLVSLIVDDIGDVVEVEREHFEPAPSTLPDGVKRYIKGIYKMNGGFLSVVDLDAIARELSPKTETANP
jgi:purine-binding chemotaxis protein CheW